MASQPTFAPYTPLRHAVPKPNIRIAYIAGDASIAIHRGMAAEPAAKRESTLEELAIAGLTEELIAAGRKLLSPTMYAAFLHWGEVASHFSTEHQGDEEGTRRCKLASTALSAVTAITPVNLNDMALKMYLASMEAADCAAFSALSMADAAMGNIAPDLIESLARDLPAQSPVIACLEELGKLAWTASGEPAFSLSLPIGTIITNAFSAARGELDLAIPAPSPLPAVLDGYSPYMRGPLVAWRKAYAVYEATTAEFKAHDRESYTPANDRYLALTNQRSTRTGEAAFDAALAEAEAKVDEAQDRFDELLDHQQLANEALYRIPAPSPAELAIKLSIFDQQSGWELNNVRDVVERITSDARRFGRHGAFLQSDEALLAAYAGCRTEMERSFADQAMSRDQEDAYFARLDAYEGVLAEAPATTIEGVLAKLRVAFSRNNADAWSDHAVMNPTAAEFREGLRMSGLFDRVLWAAIEDLARIGGVNLAEQGA